MKPSTKAIATGTLVLLLMPAIRLHAAATGSRDAAKSQKTADSSSSNADPAALLPSAPDPSARIAGGVTSSASGTNMGVPRIDVFVGYTYIRAVPTLAAGNRLVWLNGGSSSVAFHFTRSLALVGDFGGYHDSQIRFAGANPAVTSNAEGKAYTFLAGPRVFFGPRDRFAPFAQVLFGAIHASAVTISAGCSGAGCTPLPAETKFAMTAGGGLDVRLRRDLVLRIVQAEYLMTRLTDLTTGSSGTQNDMRLSSGVVFRFGGTGAPSTAAFTPPPPAPLDFSCSVTPSSVFAGEPIAVAGTAVNLDPARTAVYSWSANGGTVAGNSNISKIDTSSVTPGSYTVKGHVSEGATAQENADCEATYEVRAYDPPTVSCSASPSLISPGETATITAAGVSPQNRPLTYSYNSLSGTVNGTGTTATLSTAGTDRGVITVNCNVTDDVGHTASSSAAVTLETPVAAEKPVVSQLCSIHFDRDARRPSRVDNEAKACLDEIALNLQRNSDATLAIIGNSARGERNSKALASQRGVNTKAYLVADKGIDPSRIIVYTGQQDGKTVSITLIPSGATFDSAGDTPLASPDSRGHD